MTPTCTHALIYLNVNMSNVCLSLIITLNNFSLLDDLKLMYTENLVLVTKKRMYGEKPTSFSN